MGDDVFRVAYAHGMAVRNDPDHRGEVFVKCKVCGWGDEAPVVAEKYVRAPFDCHRCNLQTDASPPHQERP
jgi:hypothetical protein